MKKKPGRKTACILGCIAAAAVLAGALFITLRYTRTGTHIRETVAARRSADPAFAGLRKAVQHTRNVSVDLSESRLDSETGTIRICAETEMLKDTVRAVQNVHAYLADTEDAPERAYKIILDFHFQDDCIPQNVRYYNFSAADDEPALTLFRCEIEYDLLRDSEIEALSSMTFLPAISPVPDKASKRFLVNFIPYSRAAASTAVKPALCRVLAYLSPGFPSPATMNSGPPETILLIIL